MNSLEELLAGDGFMKGKLRQVPASPKVGESKPGFLSRRSRSTVSDVARRPVNAAIFRRKSSVTGDSDEIKQEIDDRESDDETVDVIQEEEPAEVERFRARDAKKNRVKPRFRDDNRRSDKDGDARGSPPLEPPLGEAAIGALVSILTGHVRRFFKDEIFRASLRHRCLSWLNTSGGKEGNGGNDTRVIANLREAIGIVEAAVKAMPDPRDMRKASLKLSVLGGLSYGDLKNEFTSGIPNSHLSACAHLYLSLFYRLQKKNKVSGRHLLQVFCDSPYPARTALLPSLWERLIFPHLFHLKAWYEEAESILRASRRLEKLQALEKAYNNALDVGTRRFAVYYKEWLIEENSTGAPALPSVDVPEVPKMVGPIGASSSKRLDFYVEEVEEEEEVVEKQFTVAMRNSEGIVREDEDTGSNSPNSGVNIEDHGIRHQHANAPSAAHEWVDKESHHFNRVSIHEEKGLNVESENIQSRPNTYAANLVPKAKENEWVLKKLAQDAFQDQVLNNLNEATLRRSEQFSEFDFHQDMQRSMKETKHKLNRNGMAPINSDVATFLPQLSAEPSRIFEDIDQGSVYSGIPNDFICQLTGHLFKDPVTLETGQTFERAAIMEWFKQGKKTCPVTGRVLKSLFVPVTDFVLKCVIDGWRLEHCRNLLVFATQISRNVIKGYKSKDELPLFIIEQLLTGFSTEEQMENARHFISLGGLHFLTWRLEMGNLEEKLHVVSLMLRCIKAEGSCRSFLATHIEGPWILDLLHSKKLDARTNAILLMIELICLKRRSEITSFMSSLITEAIVDTMHVLLLYLQTSHPEERALVSVVLLHLDLMVEPRRYSIYREEAVDGIIVSLERSLYDRKLIENSSKALLMLGGHFSSSGKLMIETWLLKQAGFTDHSSIACIDYGGEADGIITKEEEREREEWLNKVAFVLLSNGKQSFLETLFRCLASEISELVKVCLITVAWLSNALPSLSTSGFNLSTFTSLIPLLKECVIKDNQIENQVLASISLLNLSSISECRVLLKTFAKEILLPLENIGEVTQIAKQLHTVIIS
ncbi:hypothetical protein J5N97_021735 [Dioscorea zingiberensis]|uniref:RING-type E3 ubiquitin transferase n=1 Tax=Dioscorea zingiberensis TaxID=325984 RepID=A0A9D5C9V1_9LILI|nr:hypothetical protein J5N97_021735 [Dioscorea zingiberensis]